MRLTVYSDDIVVSGEAIQGCLETLFLTSNDEDFFLDEVVESIEINI
jgi:hypothetical protein